MVHGPRSHQRDRRITPSGQISEFTAGLTSGTHQLRDIALGSDGNLWFADHGSTPAIGRITTPPTAQTVSASATGATLATVSGTANGHAQATSFHIEYGPMGVATTTTPEQSLGTTSGDTSVSAALTGLEPSTAYQARVVVTNSTDTTAGALLTFTTAAAPPPVPPTVTGVRQSAKKWRESNALAQASRASKPPVGTTFSFTLNEAAAVRFEFTQTTTGRKVKGRCVARTKANNRRRRCTRTLTVATISFVGHTGTNRLRFQGRMSRSKKLKLGRYTVVITGANTTGQRSAPHKLSLTIVKR